MPEMPEVQAHAERLTTSFAGRRLKAFRPLKFTALKTVTPAPESAYGLRSTTSAAGASSSS